MASAFNPFPAGAQIAGPPPRKTVEYGTGVVVSEDGAIAPAREVTDGCLAIAIAGFGNADRAAEDKDHDLALLRIYGARGLKPQVLNNAAAKSRAELTSTSDPQNPAGGARAQDSDGKFAGIALLKPVVVAGPPNAAAQAVLVPAEVVRDFLKANGVN